MRLNWGVTAVRAGQLEVAHQQLAHLRRIEPDSTRPLLLQAFILEERGEYPAALRCYGRTVSQVSPENPAELAYSYEMAMDFYTRRKLRVRCERLLKRAYLANACTVELCEAYREFTGPLIEHGYWFNIMLEFDYRGGLCEVYERPLEREPGLRRFQRSYQVIARDRDEAIVLVTDFAARMGETGQTVCEFVREEALDAVHAGLYEVERECLVLESA